MAEDEFFDPLEMQAARRLMDDLGLTGDLAAVVAKIRRYFLSQPGRIAPEPVVVREVPLESRKKRLRDLCNRQVGRLAAITGAEHRDINLRLVRRTGVTIASATEEQLQERLQLLIDWVAEALQA